jgi:UDP-N-acetylglucosamine acyltransferase
MGTYKMIENGAFLGPDVSLGENCSIGRHAVLDGRIIIGDNVIIGHGVIIEGDYEIGKGTSIGHHTVLTGNGRIGKGNKIGPHCTFGSDAQHIKAVPGKGSIQIGDDNVIREYTTIHLPYESDATRIGNRCFIMSFCNIEHDCVVGNEVILSIGTMFAGHSIVQDHSNLGLGAIVHQYCRIGAYAMVAMGGVVRRDVLPFTLFIADRIPRLNIVGLKRNGINDEDIRGIHTIYDTLLHPGNQFKTTNTWYGAIITDFCGNTKRGYYYPWPRHRYDPSDDSP